MTKIKSTDIDGGAISDAPEDGTGYVRKDGAWVEEAGSGGGSLPTGGTDGQVLTKQSATDGDADWETPSGGGGSTPWYFDPPVAADFTLISGDGGTIVLTDDTDAGMHIAGGTPTSGRVYRGAVKSIAAPTSAWTLEGLIPNVLMNSGTSSIGIGMRDSATGYFMMFGYLSSGTLGAYRQSNLTTFVDGAEYASSPQNGKTFLRIEYDGTTNLIFKYSADGKNWVTFRTVSRTSQFSNVPNQVGIFTLTVSSPPFPITAHCERFVLTP